VTVSPEGGPPPQRLGKQDSAPPTSPSPTCHLHCSCAGPEGHTRGTPSVSGTSFVPTFPRIPPIPPSIAAIAQRDPSVEASRARQHPSNSPSVRMFYDQSRYYEMPFAFHTRSSFFPVSLLAHPLTRMFQIKRKLRTTEISLLIATIVPNKSPMLPPSTTPTALRPPSTDSST
jgi:hypothetical protein